MVNFTKGERSRIYTLLNEYVLKQKKPFIGQRLAKQWILYEKDKNNVTAKGSTIVAYLSDVCNKLLDAGRLQRKVIRRGDALPTKVWTVVGKTKTE